MKEAFLSGKRKSGVDGGNVTLVQGCVVVVGDGFGMFAGDLLRLFVAEVFAEPHIEEVFVGGERATRLLVDIARLGDLLRCDIEAFADAPHELCRFEQVVELVAEQTLFYAPVNGVQVGPNQRVAALDVVVEEGERGTEREAVEPQADLAEFHRHRVEIDAVDAAFQDAPLEQVEIGESAAVDADTLRLHRLLDLLPRHRQFMHNRIPPEAREQRRHRVGDVVHRLDQEVPTAHRGIENLEIEKGFVDGDAKLLVRLVFGADISFELLPTRNAALYFQFSLCVAEDNDERV